MTETEDWLVENKGYRYIFKCVPDGSSAFLFAYKGVKTDWRPATKWKKGERLYDRWEIKSNKFIVFIIHTTGFKRNTETELKAYEFNNPLRITDMTEVLREMAVDML